MFSGVSKSGSPAPRPITSRPMATSSWARVVTAMVGDGLTRSSVADRKGMGGLGAGNLPVLGARPSPLASAKEAGHDRDRPRRALGPPADPLHVARHPRDGPDPAGLRRRASSPSLSPADLDLYEALLAESDHDLLAWITRRRPAARRASRRWSRASAPAPWASTPAAESIRLQLRRIAAAWRG